MDLYEVGTAIYFCEVFQCYALPQCNIKNDFLG